MITLITGLPGNAKTLFALVWIKKFAGDRPVYYSGISELKLPWTELADPERWMEAPDGAVVVIDEAQRAYRPRMHGKEVPEHVAQLETHRHRGLDIFLITQDPMLIDANARRLVGQHFNCVRVMGMERSSIYEWPRVAERPNAAAAKDAAVRMDWAFVKEAYQWYKSAEVHTHKRRIPKRLIIFIVAPFLLAACCYYAYGFFKSLVNAGEGKVFKAPGQQEVPSSAPGQTKAGTVVAAGGAKSLNEYVASYQPRIQGLAFTAPAYDAITAPVRAPIPAACVRSAKRGCKCYSEQGTALDVPEHVCADIVAKGFYQSFGSLAQAAAPAPMVASAESVQKRPLGSQAPVLADPESASPVAPDRQATVPVGSRFRAP